MSQSALSEPNTLRKEGGPPELKRREDYSADSYAGICKPKKYLTATYTISIASFAGAADQNTRSSMPK